MLTYIPYRRGGDFFLCAERRENTRQYVAEIRQVRLADAWPPGAVDALRRGDMDVPTSLYRYFGPDMALLYIGTANDLERRDCQHMSHGWRMGARFIHVEWFNCREAAEWAEEAAIHFEAPEWNRRARSHCPTTAHRMEQFAANVGEPFQGSLCAWFRLDEGELYPVMCEAPDARTERERSENV